MPGSLEVQVGALYAMWRYGSWELEVGSWKKPSVNQSQGGKCSMLQLQRGVSVSTIHLNLTRHMPPRRGGPCVLRALIPIPVYWTCGCFVGAGACSCLGRLVWCVLCAVCCVPRAACCVGMLHAGVGDVGLLGVMVVV